MDKQRAQAHGHWQLDLKLRTGNCGNSAITRLEVIVVVAAVFLVGLFVLAAVGDKQRARKIACTSHLKQLSMAYRLWEGDHAGRYPMYVSVTNGGSMELIRNGNMFWTFKVMSNEISAPIILHCPADLVHSAAKSFEQLSNSNISYFVNLDASEANPQQVLIGDSNLEINGKPVKSGVVSISTNDVVSWQDNRHRKFGNIGMADGSVQSASVRGLRSYFQNSGEATNRLAIP